MPTPSRARSSDGLIGRSLLLPSGCKLRLLSLLGQGAYGTVYLALDQQTKQCFAVKHLRDHHLTPQQRLLQRQEAKLHLRCTQHPNIVQLHEVVEAAQPGSGWFIVMEFCNQRDLFDYITGGELAKEADPVSAAKLVFSQLCSAVHHCHQQNVYHRDLKPENILLAKDARGNVTCRIADFGLATDQRHKADKGCGSDFYMAPESRKLSPEELKQSGRQAAYDPAKGDVWALGVLMCNLACGRNPWNKASVLDRGFSHFAQNPRFGLRDLLPITEELNRILIKAFHPDPQRRPDVLTLLDMVMHCRRFRRSNVPFGHVRPVPGMVEEQEVLEAYIEDGDTSDAQSVVSSSASSVYSGGCPATPTIEERIMHGIQEVKELDLDKNVKKTSKSSTMQDKVRQLLGISA